MNFLQKIILALYRRGQGYSRKIYIEKLKERGLTVGQNLTLLQDVIIDDTHCWHITIGDDVTIAPRVHILAHDASTKTHLGYTKIGKVSIGNRVFVGASSVIMPGVAIGDDAVIGAGSIVTSDVALGTVVAGNPAKIIMPIEKFLQTREAEMTKYPLFGEEYTMRKGIGSKMKDSMNNQMKDRYGYIV